MITIINLENEKPEQIDPELFIEFAIYYYKEITDGIILNLNLNPEVEVYFKNDINEFKANWNDRSKIIKVKSARDFVRKFEENTTILEQLKIKIPEWIRLVNDLINMVTYLLYKNLI